MMKPDKNVVGKALETCGLSPLTGFKRDGCCHTPNEDLGVHGVCSEVTKDFLDFTKTRGNDLSTPNPVHGFEGLKPGDRWCLCAGRWKEAMENGVAPPVILEATSEAVLDYVSLDVLLKFASDTKQ